MTDPRRTEGGYRGALPARQDGLARPWIVAVIAIFLLIFVFAFAGLPSRLFVEPTPMPVFPSASASGAPSASGGPSASEEASGSEQASSSGEPSASP
ncbi:MAG TPA: hypothetical protein VEW45_01575 [Candidatus Dormibacteraeota bacterium]|nr:hypothetical protein [Candidatus Dormibacteraeota bacterium]